MSLDLINLWHQRARPTPTDADFNVQLGCHFEEIAEMLECVALNGHPATDTALHNQLWVWAKQLKEHAIKATITNREGFLDSIADRIVTGVGVAHCAKMDAVEGARRVNRSNFSKFDNDGQPIRDANGKITKGPTYAPPDLSGLY